MNLAPSTNSNEPIRLPRWIVGWLIFSGVIQTYDAAFVLTKPLSDVGGPLGFLWPGHHLYANYDGRYAAFDAFGSAQSWGNLVEVLLIVWVLRNRRSAGGVLGALIVCVATFWKTVLYFLVEMCGHLAFTKHVLDAGDTKGFLGIVIAPNAIWLVMPALAIVALFRLLRSTAMSRGRPSSSI
jgi:uroporphyrin-III C-methyltransferase